MDIHEIRMVLDDAAELEELLQRALRIARASAINTCTAGNVKTWCAELLRGIVSASESTKRIRADMADYELWQKRLKRCISGAVTTTFNGGVLYDRVDKGHR